MFKKIIVAKEIYKYYKKDKAIACVALLFAMLCAILLIAGSITIGLALNALDKFVEDNKVNRSDLNFSLIFSGITIAIYFFYWISQSMVYRIFVWLSHKAGSRIREEIFKNVVKLSMTYMNKKKTGELISRTSNDVDQLVVSLTESLASVAIAPFVIVFVSIFMLLLSPYLGLIYFAMLPLIFVGASLISSKASPHFANQQEKLGKLNGASLEFIENREAIYFSNRQNTIFQKYRKLNKDYMEEVRKGEYKIRLLWPWVDIIENSMYGIIFVVGAILLGSSSGTALHLIFKNYGTINFGLISTILSLARIVNGELGNIARHSSFLQRILNCAERAVEIINEKPEVDNGIINLSDAKGDIEFKNVSFGYSKDNPVIKNFSLNVKSGTKVAIVGPTGCGKTTISQLLMRFYEVDNGMIEIDGINIKNLTKESLSKLITIVFQDTHLFSISVKDNIKYGTQKNITTRIVEKATKEMDSSHFINVMPEGYDTIIKYSSMLSTGQSQLLALSRAYVNDSKILILDEATSSIDTKTELEVQKGMLKLMEGKTSFVIAHRLSTIINSDLIIVMNNGQIVEKGKHSELLEKKGFYWNLYNAKL